MQSFSNKIVTLILLTTTFYGNLLIAGGVGPFALYDDFWTCRCSDLYEDSELDIDLIFSPELIGETGSEEGDDNEICRASDSLLKQEIEKPTDSTNGICKRKLPMRYLSMLLTNLLAVKSSLQQKIIKPRYDLIALLSYTGENPLLGHPNRVLRPPIS